MKADRPAYRVAALERGLSVLSTFTVDRPTLGTTEIARLAQLPVATAYRLIQTLAYLGYVEQQPDGRYSVGMKVLELGYSALQSNDLIDASRGPLRRLATETKETTSLGVRSRDRVLYLLRFKSERLRIANVVPGSTLPMPYTSMGKLFLALDQDDDAKLGELLAAGNSLALVGPHAIRSVPAMKHEAKQIRLQGWALQDEELAPSLRSIAVPVRSPEGIQAAINIAVDGTQWSREELVGRLLPPLKRTAAEISLRLGYLDAVEHGDG